MKSFSFKVLRFFVQCALYVLERILDAADLVQERIMRLFFRREFERQGRCQMTGQCCQAIGLEVPATWLKFPRLLELTRRWHHLRYNFTSQGRDGTMLIYSCNYLTDKKTCGIHRFKPKLCRDFPQRPWRGFVKVHKGCGYYFIRNGGKDLSRMVEEKRARR